jgi:hypothetical protein
VSIDPAIAEVLDEVERWRQEARSARRQMEELIAQGAGTGGLQGLVLRLTGRAAEAMRQAEEEVRRLRAVELHAQQQLRDATQRLEALRAQTNVRPPPPEGQLVGAAQAALSALTEPGARQLGVLQELTSVVEGLRKRGLRLTTAVAQERTKEELALTAKPRTVPTGPLSRWVRNLTDIDVSGRELSPADEHQAWADDVARARSLASELGMELQLPVPASLVGSIEVERSVPELTDLARLLRDTHDQLRGRVGEVAVQPADWLAVADAWSELLQTSELLLRVAGTGGSRIDLLGPLATYRAQAEQVRVLAEATGLPLVPPMPEGADLFAFVEQVRDGLAGWRDEVATLRAMAADQSGSST